MRGKFIVFEGLDGSGKTTQFNRLAKTLSDLGIPHVSEKEPSDGVAGLIARKAVQKRLVLRPESLALIFAADRIEHIENELLPALNNGAHVLCDRYVFSSLAYQSQALPIETIAVFNGTAINRLLPDLTLFIDASPEICMNRIYENRNAPELFESIEQARVIRNSFFRAFDFLKGKANVEIIDGNGSADYVSANVWNAVKPLFE